MADVFPLLPGLAWNVKKTPMWSTKVQTSANGKEKRAAMWSYPIWKFELGFEFLRDDPARNDTELKTIAGFFNKMQGKFKPFWFKDPNDHWLENQQIGIGNGTGKTFNVVRPFGEFVEPVGAVDPAAKFYINGALQGVAAYSVGERHVTFDNAPSSGLPITVTGDFFFKVRFEQDQAEFNLFMYNLYELKKVELVSLK